MIRFIKPQVECIKQENIIDHIERCARVCYDSGKQRTYDEKLEFLKNICSKGHTSVLEHGTVVLNEELLLPPVNYSQIAHILGDRNNYLITNARVLYERGMDLESIVNITQPTFGRHTMHIICDRGISHELVRHRVFSYSMRSQRYVTENKTPTFIIPSWFGVDEVTDELIANNDMVNLFVNSCESSMETYNYLLRKLKPQAARGVLPNAIMTEMYMTGTDIQWQEFLKLRDNPAAHPDMQVIAKMIKQNLEN